MLSPLYRNLSPLGVGRAYGASGFTPASISGLDLWLDANEDTYQDTSFVTPAGVGDSCAGWVSIDSNAHQFIQGTAGSRPTVQSAWQAGLRVIRFDGNDYLKKATAFLTSAAGTVFAVYRLNSTLGTDSLLSSADESVSNSYCEVRAFWDAASGRNLLIAHEGSGAFDAVRGDTTLAINTTYIAMWQSSGSAYVMRVNGIAQTPAVILGSNSGDWWGDASGRDNTVVGARVRSSEDAHCRLDLGELIVYDTELSTANRDLVEDYLADRWGVTL